MCNIFIIFYYNEYKLIRFWEGHVIDWFLIVKSRRLYIEKKDWKNQLTIWIGLTISMLVNDRLIRNHKSSKEINIKNN